jgi:hypothetical protein
VRSGAIRRSDDLKYDREGAKEEAKKTEMKV